MVLFWRDEPILHVMRFFKSRNHLRVIRKINFKRRVGAFVTKMKPVDCVHISGIDALSLHLCFTFLLQILYRIGQLRHQFIIQDGFYGALAHYSMFRKSHAVCRQHPCKGMNENISYT